MDECSNYRIPVILTLFVSIPKARDYEYGLILASFESLSKSRPISEGIAQ